ncbi:hypothetical protein CCP3SC15_730014 [Gammaproteobacteria bacterium]
MDKINTLFREINVCLAGESVTDRRLDEVKGPAYTRSDDIFIWSFTAQGRDLTEAERAAAEEYFQSVVDQIQHPSVTIQNAAMVYDLSKAEQPYHTLN